MTTELYIVNAIDRAGLEHWHERLTEKAQELEAQVQAVHAELEARIAPLREEQERIRELAMHVRRILDLASGTRDANGPAGRSQPKNSSKELPEVAYRVLKENGSEMYYRDLAARIVEEGYHIRGSDPAIYLLAYIGKDERFTRVSRGTYALTEWNLKPRRRKGRSKKRSAKTRRAPRRKAPGVQPFDDSHPKEEAS